MTIAQDVLVTSLKALIEEIKESGDYHWAARLETCLERSYNRDIDRFLKREEKEQLLNTDK